ncbi:hypothetical protein DICPUDRAFT_50102 [Dictyostelium purpureum]|uniref:Conserved oligomeric Golgi complex subunit 2 n=1 Tax=Dictyostelium purpureum TaxID=5786 RepID=F0ZWS2_DICPU|nr:uncharacterized protein DICPUDRAFT_50102 [Dictyostelium purpureum]EGC31604.1 hypothetical protein DICPUDRAFT_50102 [Dictyostelium purpureum]|eukprot:XP_003291862.1 hypothetical protein DICPUDRAFT_50102 [Dictyostelium purpureum]
MSTSSSGNSSLNNSTNNIGGTLSASSSYNSLNSLTSPPNTSSYNNVYLNNINSFNNNSNNNNNNNNTSFSNNSSYNSEYVPLCFNKDVFISNTFDVDTFISDCRKRVNLESVQKDLREYSRHLDSELIELINKEYQSFFSLSSSLIGFDVILNEFIITQSSIKSEILSFKNEVNKVRECVEEKLNEKKSIDQKKKLLQLYISILETLGNMNHLFDQLFQLTHPDDFKKPQIQKPIDPNNGEKDVLELLIERISNSFYQIQNQMSSLSQEELNYNIFQSLAFKIKDLANKIEEKIEPIFKESLKRFINKDQQQKEINEKERNDEKILLACLRCFQIIDKINIPYKLFRSLILKPKFSQIITLRNLEINKSTTDGLEQIYNGLLDFLTTTCTPFFNISNLTNSNLINDSKSPKSTTPLSLSSSSTSISSVNSNSGIGNGGNNILNNYNFFSESVLPEIDESLVHFKQIFATGIPDLFYKNYYLTFNFIQAIELNFLTTSSNTNKDQLIQFRQSPHYTSLWKKWNFAVYFQLRFTDIATNFEFNYLNIPLFDQLVIPGGKEQQGTVSSTFFMKSSDGLCVSLDKCWSTNSIFIFDLSSKFFRLFLQLISRYDSYISDTLIPLEQELKIQKEQEQLQQEQTQQQQQTSQSTSEATLNILQKYSNITSPNISQRPSPNQALSNKQASPDNFVYVLSDILQVKSKISTYYRDLILKTIGKHQNENEIINLISNGILESCKTLDQLLPRISLLITNHLINKCSDSLQFISTIRSTYRMTNKPPPTQASAYVSRIIEPLQLFLKNKAAPSHIPSDIKLNWAILVLTPITEGFKNEASNVIQSVTQSNDILNKMVKRNKPTSSSTNEMSDIDKISIQLFLDVEKFGNCIKDLGIDLLSFSQYLSLKELVEPFKKLINDQNK